MTAPKRETDRELLGAAMEQLQELQSIVEEREAGNGDQPAAALRGMAIIDEVSQRLDMLHNELDLTREAQSVAL